MRGARSVQASDTNALELPCGVPEVCGAGRGWVFSWLRTALLGRPHKAWQCGPPHPPQHASSPLHCLLPATNQNASWRTWASCQAEYLSACRT